MKMPKSIQAVFEKPLPEDIFCGVGVAKAEADGDAIFWAENRAREAIARQLSTAMNTTIEDYDEDFDFELELESDTPPQNDSNPLPPESFAEAHIVTRVYNAEVILREKDKSGNWWCMVWAPKDQTEPRKPVTPDNVVDIMRINATELADMEYKRDFIRNGETVNAFEKGNAIPGWVFDTRSLPDNMAFGLGAAQLDNDKAALQLAKERARRSLAYSLDTEVTSAWYTFESYFTRPYEERNTSFASIYDHTALPTNLLKYAKSKDGTWWVLLGCSIDKAKIPETIWEQFDEQIEGYKGYDG